MDTAVIIALAIIVPIILLPAALVWYLNIRGIQAALAEARSRRTVVEGKTAAAVEAK